jgi:hypothetical protein
MPRDERSGSPAIEISKRQRLPLPPASIVEAAPSQSANLLATDISFSLRLPPIVLAAVISVIAIMAAIRQGLTAVALDSFLKNKNRFDIFSPRL